MQALNPRYYHHPLKSPTVQVTYVLYLQVSLYPVPLHTYSSCATTPNSHLLPYAAYIAYRKRVYCVDIAHKKEMMRRISVVLCLGVVGILFCLRLGESV